jgi:hypothetical protein
MNNQLIPREVFKHFTVEEQAYAVSQLDPFHDDPYRLVGAPSNQNTNSIVLTLNQETVVSAASFGLPTTSGSKWDLHVTSLPISEAMSVYFARMRQPASIIGRNISAEDPPLTLSPISAHGVTAGAPTYAVTPSATPSPILGIDSTLTEFISVSGGTSAPRSLRVISQAFEVVDESPEIYRQGAVCVYERPNAPNDVRLNISMFPASGSAREDYGAQVNMCSCPPNRIQQATILSSARTWRAQEGAYVIARRTGDNEFKRPGIARTCFVAPPDSSDLNLFNGFASSELVNNLEYPTNITYMNGTNLDLPFNISGAYFTGLSSEFGTYRIRSKVSYEILPDPLDTALVSQATPTLPQNEALESLISKVVALQPAGYPQTWNPAGEVWRKVLKTIGLVSTTLSPALSALNPELGAISMALGQGSTAASKLGKKKKKLKSVAKKNK